MSALRIALLDHTEGAHSRELEAGLRTAGQAPQLFGLRSVGPVEALLRRRGFTPDLSHTARVMLELVRGEFDLAHAFSAPDAAAALAWRRVAGRPVVFTCTETLDRAALADGRLRLSTLARAVEDTDALAAANDDVREAVERWFACFPTVIATGDAKAYERLYREVVQKTGVST